jgi:hypothetical protein
MSEQPSALSTIPPQPPAEGEYDVICATVTESARGRWFLDEYARRNRNADTLQVLASIERIETMIRGERDQQAYQRFRGDLLDMARAIAQTRAEVGGIKPEAAGTAAEADAAPAPARQDIFAAAERIQDVAWIMRERGLDARICLQIEALASSILQASSLRNTDDHRTQKLGEVLHYLEGRIDAMLDACTEPAQTLSEQALDQDFVDEASTDRASADQAPPDEEEVEAPSGPPHGGNGHDAGGSYAVISPDQGVQAAEALDLPRSDAADPAIEQSVPAPLTAVPARLAPTILAPTIMAPTISAPAAENSAPISNDLPESAEAVPQDAASQPDDVTPAPMAEPPPALQIREQVREQVVEEHAAEHAVEEAAATPATEVAAAPVETEPLHDPAPAPPTAAEAADRHLDIEPLVVAPVGWRKTSTDAPPAQLEHTPIAVEPLFPERLAAANPIFKPPEAVVFLVEYPVEDIELARAPAATAVIEIAAEPPSGPPASKPELQPPPSRIETMSAAEPADFLFDTLPPPITSRVPTQSAPVAAPVPSVERLSGMTAEIENQPFVPASAQTDAPAPQSPALSHDVTQALPRAEPIPQPPAARAAPPPAAQVIPTASDPLAALRAMSPEERIALFT